MLQELQTDLRFYNPTSKKNNNMIPFFSARGCKQTLYKLPAQYRNTINNKLVDLAFNKNRKYLSIITCEDKNPLAIDNIWTGMVMWIDCIQNLICTVDQSADKVLLEREPVSGSVFFQDLEGTTTNIKDETIKERLVPIAESLKKPGFVLYRPKILAMITDIKQEKKEWDGSVMWQIECREI